MNPFNPAGGGDSSPYPASNFRRSALPSAQAGPAPALAAMPAVQRKHLAIIATVVIVLALVLFHWHYNRG